MTNQTVATTLVAAALGLLAAGSAQAQAPGSMLVSVGFNRIDPQVKSGNLSAPALPDSQIDVKGASSLLVTATYLFSNHVSMQLLAGLPYKHDIDGAGAVAGAGKIGSLHQISPTLLLQYRGFAKESPLRPYVGVGATWARFYDTEGSAALTAITNPGGSPTTIGQDTSWGATVQGGVYYAIKGNWFVDAEVLKTFIKTNPTLSTGQTLSASLNPVSFNVSVGYRF